MAVTVDDVLVVEDAVAGDEIVDHRLERGVGGTVLLCRAFLCTLAAFRHRRLPLSQSIVACHSVSASRLQLSSLRNPSRPAWTVSADALPRMCLALPAKAASSSARPGSPFAAVTRWRSVLPFAV